MVHRHALSTSVVVALVTSVSLVAAEEAAATTPDAPTPAPALAMRASAPPATVTPEPRCTLGAHPGIDRVDAETSADVVCHELAKRGDAAGRELRMGRLGSRIILTVSSPDGAHEDKRLMVSSLEEVPTAATRLAEAAFERRPIEETERVDNVVSGETRTAKMRSGQIGVKGGIMGAMPVVGAATSAAPLRRPASRP